MREPPNISEERLRACIQDQYGLSAVTLTFLPLGADVNAGVYRIACEDGAVYLLKATTRSLYAPSCLVPRYLRDQGITSVVAPIPTRRTTLWTRLDAWTITVYPFIAGESGWQPAVTAAQWRSAGTTFRAIHQCALPADGFRSLRTESFDPTAYRRSMRAFESQHLRAESEDRLARALRADWLTHQATIHEAMDALEALASVLQDTSGPYVICHADLHPGNLLRDAAGGVFVIDWDEVMLAPKERDLLFVGAVPGDGTASREPAPFFQGYGETAIDWTALTYYLWERAVQDLIECANSVCLRDDLGEDNKAEELRIFRETLTGSAIPKALAAAAHLPPNTRLHQPRQQ